MPHPLTLSPDAQARANAWLALIDEHIAMHASIDGPDITSRLRDLRGALVANAQSDAALAFWLGSYAEALRSEFRFAQARLERHKERAHAAVQLHRAAATKAAADHRAAAKKAAHDYAALVREARA